MNSGRIFKFGILALVMSTCLQGSLGAQGVLRWHHDMEKAKADAKSFNKNILVFFTGSDWCPPCKALESNVLKDPVFIRHTSNRWVLLELDFPKTKSLGEAQARHNDSLRQKFGVSAFPTMVIATPDGELIAGVAGYGGQKASFYYKRLKEVEAKYSNDKERKQPDNKDGKTPPRSGETPLEV